MAVARGRSLPPPKIGVPPPGCLDSSRTQRRDVGSLDSMAVRVRGQRFATTEAAIGVSIGQFNSTVSRFPEIWVIEQQVSELNIPLH